MAIRQYIRKKSTGAIWSSTFPYSMGIWRKESLGTKSDDTCPPGAVTNGNFFPFSRKNKDKFEVI